MNRFLKILAYLKGYRTEVTLNLLANVFFVVFNLLTLIVFIPFLNLLFGDNPDVVSEMPDFAFDISYFKDAFAYQMGEQIAAGGSLQALKYLCILVMILFFLKNLFRYLAYLSLAKIRQGIGRDIRRDIYNKVITLPLSFFSDERKGDIMARNTLDVVEIDNSVIGSLEMVFRDPLNVIFSFGAMLMISPRLTLFSLILLPISALIIGRISKSLKRTSRKGQDKQGELLSYLEETLGGLRIVKAFNAEGAVQNGFGKLNESFRKISIRLLNKRDLASPLNEFLGAAVMVGVVWYGGSLIFSGDPEALTGPEFIGFILLFSQSLRPIQSIAKAVSSINKGMASAERVEAITLAENNLTEPAQPLVLDGFTDAVRFEDVHFQYGEQAVLKGIDFTLTKGTTVALVGESGGGKSTIADLLPRFYDTNKGKVTIDGVDIKQARIQDVRALLGVVSQQAILFNDSIRNNIRLGHPATDEQIEQAARIAHAHDFIMALPDGYETNVGDGGGKLSGGQRQRLSIARAVLKNPPILILDEATSALDTESEKLVQDALERLMKDRTTLVIAHRLSTIRHADEILVIKDGNIAERGNHKALLEQGGLYKRLQEMQGFA